MTLSKSIFLETNNLVTQSTKLAEFIIILLLCLYTILSWLNQMKLSPDSTNYITASVNLVKTGELFVFTNWPSRSMEPIIEPYTDYPPGFPYYLAGFITIFKEPILSVAIAQSFTIVLFYLTIYLATQLLRFSYLLRLGTLLIVTFLQTFRTIHSFFWTESLFIVLSLGVGLCVVRMIQNGYKTRYWVLSFILLFLASSIKFIGISNIGWFIPIVGVELLSQNKDIFKQGGLRKHIFPFIPNNFQNMFWGLGILMSSIAPIGFWFLRNNLLYGAMTQTHELFKSLRTENFLVPFRFAYSYLLETRLIPQSVLILLLIVFVIIPFYVISNHKRLIYSTIVSGAVFHFLGVWIPSLVAFFNALNDRLLAPTITFGLLAIVYGLNYLSVQVNSRSIKYLIASLPFVFLLLSNRVSVTPKIDDLQVSRPNFPVEMYLWQQLQKIDWVSTSSHYYTDLNFKHQIFASIPHRIIWNKLMIEDPSAAKELLRHNQSFLLVSQASQEREIIEGHILKGDLLLEKIDFTDLGFTLYYSPP